ncbi:MAG: amylo-alpha-1,6-glucosidase, partial [Mycobacteriales bacterium]
VALQVAPGESVEVTLTVVATRVSASNFDADAGSALVDWSRVRVEAQDSALPPTLAAGVDDLRHLLMTDPQDPADLFAAAGAPWYLTLFGRDSLWAARMMLPFGTDLAAGTLRTLARRQGIETHVGRAEEPGKIAHELRRNPTGDRGTHFGAIYYGTVDATCLWISLLHDAWRWGMPETQVEALLPNLSAAIGWMTAHTGPATDGLLRYVDATGTGLMNQGWKDSGDSIRWRDGRIAEAPIALVEAQAYAVEAATFAAALLDGFGRAGGTALLDWAAQMRARVRDKFWVGHDQPGGPWLGIAVDAAGRTVDGLASNMGHVLGTGTLSAEESGRVARTLTSPALLDTFGIRTLASDNGGYNPIGYHTGSIWTHDSAICAWNLSRAGHAREAAVVVRTLLASSTAFEHHWPELYAGADALDRPAPYPAACRPQAWAAASAAALFSVALGPEPNAREGRLVLRPCRPSPFGEMTLHGMEFAGHSFTVHCTADGTTTVLDAPADLTIEVV